MKRFTFNVLFMGILFSAFNTEAQELYPPLYDLITEIEAQDQEIDPERLKEMDDLVNYVLSDLSNGHKSYVLFICTHNSRRSHIAHLTLVTMLDYFGLNDVVCYSGGLEATRFHPHAIDALERAGFRIKVVQQSSENPVYSVGNGISEYYVQSIRNNQAWSPT
jgi:protein-tyrosine phosphatase/arsenate reductase